MFDHCKNCNRDSDFFTICNHCNNQICILCYIQHNKKDDDDVSIQSYDSWWSINHPIEANTMYNQAKLMLDDIEYEQLFDESMIYYKSIISV